jgi:hypothetical protein
VVDVLGPEEPAVAHALKELRQALDQVRRGDVGQLPARTLRSGAADTVSDNASGARNQLAKLTRSSPPC